MSRIPCRPFVVTTLLVGASAAWAATLPPEWKHWSRFRDIRLEAEGGSRSDELVRLAVPETLFGAARSDLADLRVIDERGDQVGYVLFTRGRGPETAWREAELSDLGFVRDSYTQLVADTGEDGAVHNALEVTLPQGEEEFFTWAEVATSRDGEIWRIVRAKAPVYRFRERGFGRAATIRYPRTRDRWLRLRLLRDDAEVAVERLRVAERIQEDDELAGLRYPLARQADSPEGESWWEPDGELPPIPVAAARVETGQESFHRPVTVEASDDGREWRRVGAGNIFRFGSEQAEPAGEEDMEAGDLPESLQIGVPETTAPFWRVIVLDRGDPPIPDLGVSLMQHRRYVVFRASPGRSYRLVYGNARAEAPEYEIGALTTRDALAAARLVDLGDEVANPAWVSSEPFTERHPAILWAALGLVVAVLAWMAVRALRSQ